MAPPYPLRNNVLYSNPAYEDPRPGCCKETYFFDQGSLILPDKVHEARHPCPFLIVRDVRFPVEEQQEGDDMAVDEVEEEQQQEEGDDMAVDEEGEDEDENEEGEDEDEGEDEEGEDEDEDEEGEDEDEEGVPGTRCGFYLVRMGGLEVNTEALGLWTEDNYTGQYRLCGADFTGWTLLLSTGQVDKVVLQHASTRNENRLPNLTHETVPGFGMTLGAFDAYEDYRRCIFRQQQADVLYSTTFACYIHSHLRVMYLVRDGPGVSFRWEVVDQNLELEEEEVPLKCMMYHGDRLFIVIQNQIHCFYQDRFVWSLDGTDVMYGDNDKDKGRMSSTLVSHYDGRLFLVLIDEDWVPTIFAMELPPDSSSTVPGRLHEVLWGELNGVIYIANFYGGRVFPTSDPEQRGTIYVAGGFETTNQEVVKIQSGRSPAVVRSCPYPDEDGLCMHALSWFMVEPKGTVFDGSQYDIPCFTHPSPPTFLFP